MPAQNLIVSLKRAIRESIYKNKKLHHLIRTILYSSRTTILLYRLAVGRLPKRRWIYSWDDVYQLSEEWAQELRKLPFKFDVIVGIPRAGLIVADILALELGLPLSTPDNLARGISWISRNLENHAINPHNILIVDDMVGNGTSMGPWVKKFKTAMPNANIYSGALVHTLGSFKVDFCYCYDDKYYVQSDIEKWRYLRIVCWDYD